MFSIFSHKKKLSSFVKKANNYQQEFNNYNITKLKESLNEIKLSYVMKDGKKNRLTLDDLAKVFAITSLASWLTLSKKHFNSQLMGGFVLAELGIAEMMTGEGKTLVASLPSIACYVRGKSTHIATTNEYLAGRDAEELRPLFEALGVSVAVVTGDMDTASKQKAYACDVVYSTVSELGFDFLRDKMVSSVDERVQRGLDYILVDEADSLLIDMGVTPLIMSGQSKRDSSIFSFMYPLITEFIYVEEKDVESTDNAEISFNIKDESLSILDAGYIKLEKIFLENGLIEQENLYHDDGIYLFKAAEQCMHAFVFKQRDIDYLVVDGKVRFVDKNTGRASASRRWSGGLHQALEAKEGVKIEPETETIASIAIQNYISLYSEFSGMTGTAMSAKKEFKELYKTDVVKIPTNKPIARIDRSDLIYETKADKWNGVINLITKANSKGQPILVGTSSVEDSELLSKLLSNSKIEHSLLSAKYHEREAMIVAQAGRPYAVTIATNMAGRGTDIILGGNAEQLCKELDVEDDDHFNAVKLKCQHDKEFVLRAGGLLVIGTERSESRRIDNQLRGRSGRQGDVGESQFYLSIEDTIIKRFCLDRMKSVWTLVGLSGTGEGLESKSIDKSIAGIQEKSEGMASGYRKNTMQYDSVNQSIRAGFYDIRDSWVEMSTDEIAELIPLICEQTVELHTENLVNGFDDIIANEKKSLAVKALYDWQLDISDTDLDELIADGKGLDIINEKLTELLINRVNEHINNIGSFVGIQIARRACLDLLDEQWVAIQSNMQELQSGSHLKGFAQKNPIVEYRSEADQLLKSSILETEMMIIDRILNAISEQMDYKEISQMDIEYKANQFWIHPDFKEMMNYEYAFKGLLYAVS